VHRLHGTAAEFSRFLLFGAFSAGVNWTSRLGYSLFMPFSQAVIVAYLTGMVTAFLLFRAFVFPRTGRPIQRQALWFVAVNMVGMALVWTFSMLLVTKVFPAVGFRWHAEAVGHGIAMATPVMSSFLGHKYLTYRLDRRQAD
jgi:putative flippase GtrA